MIAPSRRRSFIQLRWRTSVRFWGGGIGTSLEPICINERLVPGNPRLGQRALVGGAGLVDKCGTRSLHYGAGTRGSPTGARARESHELEGLELVQPDIPTVVSGNARLRWAARLGRCNRRARRRGLGRCRAGCGVRCPLTGLLVLRPSDEPSEGEEPGRE